MERLKDKIIAITGAGSGIGKTAAKMFAAENATVLVLELNEASAKQTVAEIEAAGGKAKAYCVDVSNSDSVKKTFEAIDADFDGLDGLYNNAGVFWGKKDAPLDVLDPAVFETIVKINLFGHAYCAKYAIPLMKKRGGGTIVMTGSSAGVIGIPKCDSYTASKGGIVTLTRSMAVEFGPFNIRTNCICPAAIWTPKATCQIPTLTNRHFSITERRCVAGVKRKMLLQLRSSFARMKHLISMVQSSAPMAVLL